MNTHRHLKYGDRVLIFCGLLAWALFSTRPAEATQNHTITVANTVAVKRGEKWNPVFWFGNLDDRRPPPDYRPHDRNRVHKWYLRNPTHNLTFYVVGIADKTFRRSGKYPDQVFSPRGGWNWTVCNYRGLRLPFLSYRMHSFSFYLGWRERGNFGAKLNFK